jgi:predicted transcriptional regulator
MTLNLPEDVKAALDDVAELEGISSDELVTEAVKQYLFVRQFRILRDRMVPQAEAQGILTDQDVFDRVS